MMAGAALAPFLARGRIAHAQNWPSGILKIVVPFPPGGTVDPIARLVQNGMQQRLGATIVIENKSGGSGSAGTASVAKSAPDGNTWLFVFDTHSVNPYLMNLQYDTEKDLDPVMLVATAPYLLAVNTKHDFKTLADVLAVAKAKPEGLSYASVGSGSIGHLFMVLLQKKTGVKLTHVPYRGGGPAMNDILSGQVDLFFEVISTAAPQVQSKRAFALLATGNARSPLLPDVPTTSELGYPGLNLTSWTGLAAAAGTPAPIVELLNKEANVVMQSDKMTDLLAHLGIRPVGGSPAKMAERIAQEADFFSIGTNDLIQYAIAVDRVNERIAHLYEPSHPAVLRLIKMVADAARQHQIWFGICGEMAGEIELTPLLLGLGVDELSVSPALVPRVKSAIRNVSREECEKLVEEALLLDSPAAILERSLELARERYGELLG